MRRKAESGDVVIPDVPMVDQGQKGYCVVACAERLMRCRQNTHVSVILEKGFDHPGDGLGKMLTVVDDYQKSLVV